MAGHAPPTPEQIEQAIWREIEDAAASQAAWARDMEVRELAQKASDGYIKGDALESRCADSREKVAAASSKGAGVISSYCVAGGFTKDSSGKLFDDYRLLKFQRALDGVEVNRVRQHSGCGMMNNIYNYHVMAERGEEAHVPAEFAAEAIRRASLFYKTVNKLGPHRDDFGHYEKVIGLPMGDVDNETKIKNCMALQEGLDAYKADLADHKANPNLPEPVMTYTHVTDGGWVYALVPEEKKMIRLPHPDHPDYKEDLAEILTKFPKPQMKEIIVSATHEQKAWMEENLRHMMNGGDMCEAQAPHHAAVRSCSPGSSDPYDQAKGAGNRLNFSMAGACMTTPFGGLSPRAGQFTELAGVYGVPVVTLWALNDRGGVNEMVYDYHRSKEGAAKVAAQYGEAGVAVARSRGDSYTSVVKELGPKGDDFSTFKKMGVPLTGDRDNDFITCLAVAIGLRNEERVQAKKQDETGKWFISTPVLFLRDVHQKGRVLKFDSTAGKFTPVDEALQARASLTASPNRPVGANSCGCGKGAQCCQVSGKSTKSQCNCGSGS